MNILDLIDNAIAGNTSTDAMRWTPDPEAAATEMVEIDITQFLADPTICTPHGTWTVSRIYMIRRP